MLFTTSRHCPEKMRALGKALAVVFSGSYVARGKKSMDSLAGEARRDGHSRICVIGADSAVSFIVVDELGAWSWLDDVIVVRKAHIAERLGPCSSIEGAEAEKLSGLLGFDGSEKYKNSVLAEGGKISFGGLLELEVSYERLLQHKD